MSDEDDGIYNTMVIVNNELEILQEYKKQKISSIWRVFASRKIA